MSCEVCFVARRTITSSPRSHHSMVEPGVSPSFCRMRAGIENLALRSDSGFDPFHPKFLLLLLKDITAVIFVRPLTRIKRIVILARRFRIIGCGSSWRRPPGFPHRSEWRGERGIVDVLRGVRRRPPDDRFASPSAPLG